MIVETFLNQTEMSRERTHYLAWADEQQRIREEQEKERKSKPTQHPYGETNSEWDDWDDWYR